MGMPAFLDLIMPQLEAPLFTVAIDKWGTGTWDFGHINDTKYTGSLNSVPVDDSCNIGGCWKVGDIKAQFPEGPIPQGGCAMFGKPENVTRAVTAGSLRLQERSCHSLILRNIG